LNHGLDLFQGLDGKFGGDRLIFTDVVDDLLVLLFDLDQKIAKLGIMERPGRLDNQFRSGLVDLLFARLGPVVILLGLGNRVVRLEGVQFKDGERINSLKEGEINRAVV